MSDKRMSQPPERRESDDARSGDPPRVESPESHVDLYSGNGSLDPESFELALMKAEFPVEPKALSLSPEVSPVRYSLFLPVTVEPWQGWLVLRSMVQSRDRFRNVR